MWSTVTTGSSGSTGTPPRWPTGTATARNEDDPEADRAAARPGSVAHSTIELAGFVARLRTQLVGFAAAVGWRDRVAQARRALEDVLGASGTPRRWPPEEQDAFDAVIAALDRLAALESVEATPAPGAFARAVDAELAAPSGRVGRFGDGVLCAPIGSAVGLDLDAVFVVGLAEGLLPRSRRRGRAPGGCGSAARGRR